MTCQTNEVDERQIVKGEDKSLSITLTENGLPKNVTGWTITAQIESRSKSAPVANGTSVTCDSGATGADFSAGIIVATWTDTQTAAMSAGKYQLKITGTDGSGLITKWIADEAVSIVG